MRKSIACVITWLTLAAIARADDQNCGIASPDGNVQFMLVLNNKRPTYSVTLKGKPVIESSPMGLSLDGVDLTEQVRGGVLEGYDHNETYPTRGGHATANDHHNGWRMPLTHIPSKAKFDIEVRAFNDGIAFRFIVPKDGDKSRAPDEATTFAMPAGSNTWFHNLRGHYEGDYAKHAIADVKAGDWAAVPLTVKLPDGAGYASITEADLVNYSGMALEADGKRGFVTGLGHRQPVSYPYELRYSKEDVERLSHAASIAGEIVTPWRVIIVGQDLNALVNSDILSNLSPPPDTKLFPQGIQTDWVKPGRAVWRYLDTRAPGSPPPAPATTRTTSRPVVTLDEMKTYSRLAGELGFEYNVLEGFWARWSDDDLRELVNYSKQRNVGLFVWVHSKEMRDPEVRRKLYQRCHDCGIVGLKIDFFDHEHKETIDLYAAILAESAQNKLLLNFHGANKPAGESRTWPNELNREAIHGMEASKLADRSFQNTVSPFARFVAGHADYTPVMFNERRADTTWAHQIATAAVFTAPLLIYAAHPQNILNNPACAMMKSIPATWDQTIVLPGSEIGESVVFARRKGNTWFLAVLNGQQAKKMEIPLSFLGDGSYRAMLVGDRPGDSAAVAVTDNQAFDRSSKIPLDLRAGGGFIARFTQGSGDSK